MKTQVNTTEKLHEIIEEKDRKIAELELQVEWLMSQIRLAKHAGTKACRGKGTLPQTDTPYNRQITEGFACRSN
jgi:iron only hydrogenase large subunit-like protein